ncbi:hypothetical protein N2152v2_002080 [Parachlorella kessleri]
MGNPLRPLRTSVVRLRYFKKSGTLETEKRIDKKIYKRLYILALTPDALQLYTTRDSGLADELVQQQNSQQEGSRSLTSSFTNIVKAPVRALTSKREVALSSASSGSVPGAAADKASADAVGDEFGAQSSADSQADLEEGQVFTISVALNQVVSVTQQDGRCLRVAFRPNKPNRKKAEEDTITFMKGLFFPVWYPIEASLRDTWDLETFMENHMRKDPTVHTFLLEAPDAAEAAALRTAIETARDRLWQALQWLSKDLPLLDATSISLISMDCPAHIAPLLHTAAGSFLGSEPTPKPGAGARRGGGGARAGSRLPPRGGATHEAAAGTAPAAGTAGEAGSPALQPHQVVLATHPSFGDRLPLPVCISEDIAAGNSANSGDGGGGRARVLHVWLHTALGPAQVDIVPSELLKDAEVAAGCPFTLRAEPTAKDKAGMAVRGATTTTPQGIQCELEVLLRCSLCRGEELPPGPPPTDPASSSNTLPSPTGAAVLSPSSSTTAAAREPSAGPGITGSSDSSSASGVAGWLAAPSEGLRLGLAAILGILVVILANWVQLAREAGVTPASSVLQSVSFLVSSLCGLGLIGAIALRYQPRAVEGAAAPNRGAESAWLTGPARGGPSAKAPAAHPTCYRWYLELLEADLVESAIQEQGEGPELGAGPPLVRSISVTSAKPVEGAAPGAPGKDLPRPIQRLIEQHPGLVTPNVAERFLIGWGTPAQAYTGLVDMVDWMRQQGLEGVSEKPQPHFHVIKRHYTHGIYGRSRNDCPVEVECMGQWKAAYNGIRRDGVSEQALLHHLCFIYEYTFTHVDPRPLPHGKTVKIIDLEGLCMGDLRSDAVKFLTKVGALLNLNYPQRLHRCFLVNAPTWWAVVWRMVSPMIAKKTREQMFLFGKTDQEAMRKAILEEVAPDQLPEQYGGTCKTPLYESRYERQLAQHVQRVNGTAAPASGTPAAAAASMEAGSV